MALLALLKGPEEFYAMRLKAALDGWGTSDKAVCRILGCNDKPMVKAIADKFESKYGVPLKDAIKKVRAAGSAPDAAERFSMRGHRRVGGRRPAVARCG